MRRMNWRMQYVLQCRVNFGFVNMSHDGEMTFFIFPISEYGDIVET